MYKDVLDYVCCPICKNNLYFREQVLFCEKCSKNYEIENGVIKFDGNMSPDLKLSIKKWDELYAKEIAENTYSQKFDIYDEKYAKNLIGQILELKDGRKAYLEIGCGQFFNGIKLARDFDVLIGIDICPSALAIAKKMFEEKNIGNFILIQGNILDMPLRPNSIDFIYGGGVIEHFQDTQKCVNELYRCLSHNGVSFNTVPYLNLGSLTYRQIWGNIPNMPILKQLAEFVHIRLLKSRHMIFGYEFSFTARKMEKIHQAAGFGKNNVRVEKFDVDLIFEFLPKFSRKLAAYLANNVRLFWPMIKVVAKK